jgi:hypothetical protein
VVNGPCKNFIMVFQQIIQLLSGVAHSSFAYETLWNVWMWQVDILGCLSMWLGVPKIVQCKLTVMRL